MFAKFAFTSVMAPHPPDSISYHHVLRMEDYSLDDRNSKAASPEL